MPGYVWELPGAGDPCKAHAPGHQIHWVQFNVSMREPAPVIPVTASVDADGRVHIDGDDLCLVRFHHRPALLRAALERFGGQAVWKPRWHLLAVPTDTFIGGPRTVFNLATAEQWLDCRVWASDDPADRAARADVLGYRRFEQLISAEQEARNAELRAIDDRHIPPLRLADRYAHGRPRQVPPRRLGAG